MGPASGLHKVKGLPPEYTLGPSARIHIGQGPSAKIHVGAFRIHDLWARIMGLQKISYLLTCNTHTEVLNALLDARKYGAEYL